MAGSVNKVIIVGNLARDPEVRTFQNGDRVANMTVATSERWKDKQSGEAKEKAEFHRVSIFGPMADIAEKYLAKGSKVYLEGALETRKWTDKNGADQYTTEVVLRQFGGTLCLLDKPAERQEEAMQPASPRMPGGRGAPTATPARQTPPPPASRGKRTAPIDDDIPF